MQINHENTTHTKTQNRASSCKSHTQKNKQNTNTNITEQVSRISCDRDTMESTKNGRRYIFCIEDQLSYKPNFGTVLSPRLFLSLSNLVLINMLIRNYANDPKTRRVCVCLCVSVCMGAVQLFNKFEPAEKKLFKVCRASIKLLSSSSTSSERRRQGGGSEGAAWVTDGFRQT